MTQTLLVAIDDTDELDYDVGTGKASRRLAARIDETLDVTFRGSVRQQLLVDPRVPYTTHNSAACLRFETDGDDPTDAVVDVAADYLRTETAPNADPGLCVGYESAVTGDVVAFGEDATEVVVDEDRAYELAADAGVFLDEYGGTGEGVIGALAAVGLTAAGERGRFIAYDGVRSLDGTVPLDDVRETGVRVVDADGEPVERGELATEGWVRPQLRNGRATLPVTRRDDGVYEPANLSERGGK